MLLEDTKLDLAEAQNQKATLAQALAALQPDDEGYAAATKDLAKQQKVVAQLEVEVAKLAREEVKSDTRLGLQARAHTGDFLAALARGNKPDGAGAELAQEELKENQHDHLGNPILPWAMIAPRAADAPSTLTSGQPATQSWVERVFDGTAARFMGIDFVEAPPGYRNFVVTSGGADPAQRAEGAAPDSEQITFAVETAKPKRLSSNVQFHMEDVHESPGLEEALRSDLRASLADSVDRIALRGSGGSNAEDIAGIAGETTAVNAGSAIDTNAEIYSLVFNNVDGKYAKTPADIRLVLGSKTYGYIAGKFFAKEDSVNLPMFIERTGAKILVSDHAPAPTGSAKLQVNLVAKVGAMARTAAACTWGGGVSVIRDQYSGSASATVRLTMALFWDLVVLHSDAFKQKQVRNTA